MIQYVSGNIFESPAEVLVNPVNLDGVMGAGLALEFRKRYPTMYEKYLKACSFNRFKIGTLMLIPEQGKQIMLFPTKIHWRNQSRPEYIDEGLRKFVDTYKQKGIHSIAFPMLGCGKGGLRFENVRPIMERYLNNIDADVYIYLSDGKEPI